MDRPLLAAELPYHEIPASLWSHALLRICQLGANTVVLRVPWRWHARPQGGADFEGTSDPQRNLIGLLDRCTTLGLDVILAPIPLLDVTAVHIPAWILPNLPDRFQRQLDGQVATDQSGLIPQINIHQPEVQQALQTWINDFSAAFTSRQAPYGPIISLLLPIPTPSPNQHPAVMTQRWNQWPDAPLVGLPPGIEDLTPPTTLRALQRSVTIQEYIDWDYTSQLKQTIAQLRQAGWNIAIGAYLDHATLEGYEHTALTTEVDWIAFDQSRHSLFDQRWVYQHLSGLSRHGPALMVMSDLPNHHVLTAYSAGALPALAPLTELVMNDGMLRPGAWHLRMIIALSATVGEDFSSARAPGNIAVGVSRVPQRLDHWRTDQPPPELNDILTTSHHWQQVQYIAQMLAAQGFCPDIIDLDSAEPETLIRYRIVLTPASRVMTRATQARLSRCANLVVVGETKIAYDERLEPCHVLERASGGRQPIHRLPEEIDTAQISALIEQHGGLPSYAWADGPQIEVTLRHGAQYLYLLVTNHRSSVYTGMLAYRGRNGDILHIHISLGGGQSGLILLDEDELVGLMVEGDASQGNWLVRAARSSATFSGGSLALVPLDHGFLLLAQQSGQVQLRRPSGWTDLSCYRLLLDGTLIDVPIQGEASHLTIPYIATDHHGATDCYLLFPAHAHVPRRLSNYLSSNTLARSLVFRQAATLAQAGQTAAVELDAHIATVTGTASDAVATRMTNLATTTQQIADQLIQLKSNGLTLASYRILHQTAMANASTNHILLDELSQLLAFAEPHSSFGAIITQLRNLLH